MCNASGNGILAICAEACLRAFDLLPVSLEMDGCDEKHQSPLPKTVNDLDARGQMAVESNA